MQEIRITISDLPEEDKIALSKFVSDNCNIEETKGVDGATNEIITILAENPILCGIAANLLTEIVKSISKEAWSKIKISVKMPDGSNFINLGKVKFLQLMKKYFDIEV
ncbi:hypothetical protein [Bacteroides sp.]|uniref:hypothetical protein n=1 Tax=Bacteroides sp. TaxID=29523 RepID=UPI003A9077DC